MTTTTRTPEQTALQIYVLFSQLHIGDQERLLEELTKLANKGVA